MNCGFVKKSRENIDSIVANGKRVPFINKQVEFPNVTADTREGTLEVFDYWSF